MIFNMTDCVYVYKCNGVNDNIALKNSIDKIVASGANNIYVDVSGNFGISGTMTASNSLNYHFVYEYSGTGKIVIDFSKAKISTPTNSFICAGNVTVKGCYLAYNGGESGTITAFYGLSGEFVDCTVIGTLVNTNVCSCFAGTDSKYINCYVNVEMTGANVYGILVSESVVDRCRVHIKGNYSAYGIQAIPSSFVSNSRFSAYSTNTSGQYSGTGGIAGGNFSNCTFLGRGALKGYGFMQQANQVVNASNCVFRGYTADSTNGEGIGYNSQNNDGNGAILMGVNCNQVTLSGYSQTDSAIIYGYGAVAGHFFKTPTLSDGINQLAVLLRNRV